LACSIHFATSASVDTWSASFVLHAGGTASLAHHRTDAFDVFNEQIQ
jgi:hypothetical protein